MYKKFVDILTCLWYFNCEHGRVFFIMKKIKETGGIKNGRNSKVKTKI